MGTRTRSWRTTAALAAALAGLAVTAACGGARGSADLADLEPVGGEGVRPGDVIDVRFWRQTDLSGGYRVDEEGRVYLPLVRSVEVDGLSERRIRARLTELYDEFFEDPLIMVEVKLGVNVTGAVNRPGRLTLDPAFTLFDALGEAGGIQPDGKRDEIELVRNGRRHLIDLDGALVSERSEALRLQSGDWIYVPRKFWTLQRLTTFATIAVLTLQIITLATR